MDYSGVLVESRPTKRCRTALKIMRNLSNMTRDDLSLSSPLSVTYVSNKKAKIVRSKFRKDESLSEDSTSC